MPARKAAQNRRRVLIGALTLAKIFLSHSRQDERIKDLFFRAFAGTGVHPVLKEYENVSPPGTPPSQINRNMAEEIESDILSSSAVFVILSETVQQLQHTTHWIAWESGQAKAKQKPVWVFEPFDTPSKVEVAIPHFNHYVRFQMNDYWRRYIHTIVASYNDTPVLTGGGGLLAGLWLAGPIGGLIGAAAGYLLAGPTSLPKGFSFTCAGCFLSYEVHLPNGRGEFRCACCNSRWLLT
jgi:nucleoside 2-deoxyribosyltransferase